MKKWWTPPLAVFVLAFLVAGGFWFKYGTNNSEAYWQGIAVEAGGVALEIFLITLLLGSYEFWNKNREYISNLRRRIDDFKGLDDDYAHVMIASSIRELAKKEITNIDFSGCRLTNFSFHDEGIKSLKDSVFADGLWIFEPRKNFGHVKKVDFSSIDCRNVKFSSSKFSFTSYENCNFWRADLRNAIFNGASLKWDAELVIADEPQWYEIGETEDGESYDSKIYVPAFDSADLGHANFDKCDFKLADFRGAKNILNASFVGAKGLDTCFFDDGIKEQLKVV